MSPQEAKTKIENLLDLGTLRGVRVEYDEDDGYSRYFYKLLDGRIWSAADEQCAENSQPRFVDSDEDYQTIKSITPIPLEPKLLEVGTEVQIIGGLEKGKRGTITGFRGHDYVVLVNDNSENLFIEQWSVVPESLLVEEDENKEAKAILGEFQYNTLIKAGYKVTKE